MILNERDWSWTIIAFAALISALIIRSWFLGGLVKEAKALGSKLYQPIKIGYIQNAIWGWIFLLASVGGVSYMWTAPISFPLSLTDFGVLIVTILFFVLALLLHLIAFNRSTLKTLKQYDDDQKLI